MFLLNTSQCDLVSDIFLRVGWFSTAWKWPPGFCYRLCFVMLHSGANVKTQNQHYLTTKLNPPENHFEPFCLYFKLHVVCMCRAPLSRTAFFFLSFKLNQNTRWLMKVFIHCFCHLSLLKFPSSTVLYSQELGPVCFLHLCSVRFRLFSVHRLHRSELHLSVEHVEWNIPDFCFLYIQQRTEHWGCHPAKKQYFLAAK